MSVQRYVKAGRVRYRARIKHHGREVATQVFDRKNDAVAWEQEQPGRPTGRPGGATSRLGLGTHRSPR